MITLAKCLDHQNKELLWISPFALTFLFFSFFFSKLEHLIITMAITTIMIFSICSTTWNVLPYLMIT